MLQNKTIAYLLILALTTHIPAQATENTSAPANNTTANISQTTNQTQTQEQLEMVQKVTETLLLIGIILSPISFLLSVVALWVAWKNRRQTYNIR